MTSWMYGIEFLHLSDIHIPDTRGEIWKTVDPCKKLEKLIEHIKQLELKPKFTVITGDISNTGTNQSYKLAEKYISDISDLGGPVFPTMGTKDDRANFREILLRNISLPDDEYCYYSYTTDMLQVIIMDSHTPGSNIGSFASRQLDWLEKELENRNELPAIIAFHEPVFFFGEAGVFNKVDALRFREVISRGNVLAVLNGHLHCPFVTVIDGVYYIQAGSPLWENSYRMGWYQSYDSSSFNLLWYGGENLSIRPIGFSDEVKVFRKIIET